MVAPTATDVRPVRHVAVVVAQSTMAPAGFGHRNSPPRRHRCLARSVISPVCASKILTCCHSGWKSQPIIHIKGLASAQRLTPTTSKTTAPGAFVPYPIRVSRGSRPGTVVPQPIPLRSLDHRKVRHLLLSRGELQSSRQVSHGDPSYSPGSRTPRDPGHSAFALMA